MLYLSLTCLALVALLAYREWGAAHDRREIAAERAETAKERRELYQRIQAPEAAVLEHVRKERGEHRSRRPIGADDDAAFRARDMGTDRG